MHKNMSASELDRKLRNFEKANPRKSTMKKPSNLSRFVDHIDKELDRAEKRRR